MRKAIASVIYSGFGFCLSLLFVSSAFAQEATGPVDYTHAFIVGICIISAGLVISVGAFAVGPVMGKTTGEAATAISRNPEAHGKILLAMVVGMAMTESICIYALVISLITLYANPLLKYIFG